MEPILAKLGTGHSLVVGIQVYHLECHWLSLGEGDSFRKGPFKSIQKGDNDFYIF